MRKLAEAYVKHGFPNHKVWNFDTGAEGGVHAELRALGLLKMIGTKGSAWVLTDAGQEWIMENRDV